MPSFSFACLLPDIPGIQLETLSVTHATLVIHLSTTTVFVPCPVCGVYTRQIHSRYVRHVADLPWGPAQVGLQITARKFVCINDQCPRKIFVERLGGAVLPHARRSLRLATVLAEMAFALGGEAGAAVSRLLQMPVSAATLLRIIRRTPLPAEGQPTAVGVDDWAIRKSSRYGTIVVDLVAHRPIALFADRAKEPFTDWLTAHPAVQVISRDRASAYANAADEAAPHAIQVADRFHLAHNVMEVVQRIFERHGQELHAVAQQIARVHQQASSATEDPTPDTAAHSDPGAPHAAALSAADPPAPTETPRQHAFRQVKLLHAQGLSDRAIARHLAVDRRTVKRYVRAAALPQRGSDPRQRSSVTPYLPYLRERWASGFCNKRQLWMEITARGYTGSLPSVYRALAYFALPDVESTRITRPSTGRHRTKEPRIPVRSLSARRAAWLLLGDEQKLSAEARVARTVLLAMCPIATPVLQLGQSFRTMVRDRRGEDLDDWLRQAEDSDIAEFVRFAASLRRDYSAVKAGLSQEVSNAQTEGQITRLKWLKRAMFGRANLDLLRQRVLHQRAA